MRPEWTLFFPEAWLVGRQRRGGRRKEVGCPVQPRIPGPGNIVIFPNRQIDEKTKAARGPRPAAGRDSTGG